jgi:hypothetical protein
MVYGFITSCCFLLVFSLVCTVQRLSVSRERKLTLNIVALHGRATQRPPTSTVRAKGSYVQWPHHLSTCYVFLCSEASFVLCSLQLMRVEEDLGDAVVYAGANFRVPVEPY